jgi:hypothetical protein
MSDFPTSLRVIAAYKAGEDLADRLATAVAVQQSMSVALHKAADEIERLEALRVEDGKQMSALIAECQEMKDRLVDGEEGTAVSDNCVAGNYPEIGCRLTDAERDAIKWYADFPDGIHRATLRNLLERMT